MDKERTLWIDQICIHQRDNGGKETQVPLMRDIYRQAEQVIIWLGGGDQESELAFQAIEKIHQSMLQSRREHQARGEAPDISSISASIPLLHSSMKLPQW